MMTAQQFFVSLFLTSKQFLKKYSLFIFIGILTTLIYSKSSPLYFTNNWVDSNAYLTVGRGIMHGLVPYKDLFEQKGPILYLIHAAATLVSARSFLGIFFFESLLMVLNLVIFYKLAQLFLSAKRAFLTTFLLPFLFFNYSWFVAGDSAEEFAFPAILFLLYILFSKLQHNDSLLTPKDFYIQGLLFAYLFWIKYSLTGAWIAVFIALLLLFIVRRQWTRLLSMTLWALGGFLTVSLPVLLYFLTNQALGALFEVYFHFNLTAYTGNASFLARFRNIWGVVTNYYGLYPAATIIGGLAVLSVLFIASYGIAQLFRMNREQQNPLPNRIFIFAFLMTLVGQFWGGRAFGYYLFVLIPFAACGLIGLALALSHRLAHLKRHPFKSLAATLAVVSVLLPLFVNTNILYSRLFPKNTDQIAKASANSRPRVSSSAQVEFAKIIDSLPNSTLLNYDGPDYGFYLAADKLPITRYFELQNVPYSVYPQNLDSQSALIQQKKVDFVATPLSLKRAPGFLKQNYRLVASHAQTHEGSVMNFYLYQKK